MQNYTQTKRARSPKPENLGPKPMTSDQIHLIVSALNTVVCDAIVEHCKLEVDEVRLRDALIKELSDNSYWSHPGYSKEYLATYYPELLEADKK